ncbi:MAG: ECF transporter S component [Lachnospiraceae bacterium]|nr:ECF transporter S component [Lachnospiraceae bacterium]MBR5732030.1 ECF transporter S component [Lachnospiraceae bacterium]
MKAYEKNKTLLKITYAGLMAALCYVGYAIFPAINAGGTKIHIGNAFVVLGALFLGGLYGGLAGAVGLSLADILGGYGASAPRTFICKLVIGLIVGLVAHKIAKISHDHKHAYLLKWSAIASVAGLGFNCVFEPSLKYVWYTLLTPNAEKAASAIKSLVAVTTYATLINAVINSVIAVVAYLALRPVLYRAGLLGAVDVPADAHDAHTDTVNTANAQ